MKKKIETINKDLKDKLDAFLYQYSDSKEETQKEALEVLNYAFLTLTDIRTESDIDFEIQQKAGNVNLKRIEELKEERKLSQFFNILQMYIEGSLQYRNIQSIPDKQLSLYIQSII